MVVVTHRLVSLGLTIVNLLQSYLSIVRQGLLSLGAQHESLGLLLLVLLLCSHGGMLREHSAGGVGDGRIPEDTPVFFPRC